MCWLIGSVAICLYFDSEYLPFYVGCMFLAFMVHTLRQRIRGETILHLLHDHDSTGVNRFISKLRVAVVSADINEKLVKETRSWIGGIDPLVRCYYVTGECEEDFDHGGKKGTLQ